MWQVGNKPHQVLAEDLDVAEPAARAQRAQYPCMPRYLA